MVASDVAGGAVVLLFFRPRDPLLSTNCGTERHDVSLLFSYFQLGELKGDLYRFNVLLFYHVKTPC